MSFYTRPHNEVVGGYIGFTPSICPSVCPSEYISMSEQNAVHLASPDTYIKCAIQMSVPHPVSAL